ncbi:extracellular catalytic domain type 1 short-chain-length polyhydroxyalkanoate depolymerase [Rhizobium sp. SL86]|uniref:extracellular catalytic domain type 1 short-chain-length polyhydroxyalkanoate depolymerase n=1 Tax=Rhizobium sp. SL86 TaxID=2995148 RepID=UPI00227428BA|nr:PHB depolymerase family esterase [Rhizobium sp. SL86]MCY1666885.1 PHB depolymerase family esterase [Rhizobium sp. SL86]
MRSMSDTLARLANFRAMNQPAEAPYPNGADLHPFGSNPGMLQAKLHIPAHLPAQSGLVVALHGCTQSAAAYEDGSGWSRLADEYGFAVLYPQQTRQNNANTCFNWFVPEDIRRGEGEALSIRQMIDATVEHYQIDPARIYITGLSAGGAMANVMLATYPEVFAGGAILAGLPYGCAGRVPQAFDLMRGRGIPDATQLQARLRRASDFAGPWPSISVFHGTSDATVAPVNGKSIIAQWQAVHGLDNAAGRTETDDRHTRTTWQDADGTVLLEYIEIEGMGHGAPIDGGDGYSRPAPYMLDVGFSSTLHAARGWGLIPSFEKKTSKSKSAGVGRRSAPFIANGPLTDAGGIQKIIEDALRSAGLMK